jgi:hypothetical protein
MTPIINSQSFGVSPNVGELYRSVAELDPTTIQVVLNCVVTLANTAASKSSSLHVRYAWSPNAYQADVGTSVLRQASRYVALNLAPTAPSLIIEQSSLPISVPGGGGYLYLWIEAPTLPASATITVNVIESNAIN